MYYPFPEKGISFSGDGRMICTLKRALALFSLLILFSATSAYSAMPEGDASEQVSSKVLIVHSYHRGYEWTDTLHREIVQTITDRRPVTDFYVEYMDTKRYFSHGYLFDLAMIYKQKYSSMDLDLIICTDDQAYQLLQYYGANLFPHVPVVFCGLGDEVLVRRAAIEKRTGILQRYHSFETAELILKLHPDTENIALLYDSTKVALENRLQLVDRIKELPGNPGLIELPQMREKDLCRKLSELPPHTALLHLGYWRSDDGHFYSSRRFMELVRDCCDLPLYSVYDFMVNRFGAAGGLVDPAREHGRLAGERALHILAGSPFEDLPLAVEGPTRYVFDHNELLRLGIEEKELPPESIIFNEPESLFSQYRNIIFTNLLVSLILIFLAAYLFINVHRRKRAEKELTREKEFMEQLFENSPEGIVLLDKRDNIIRANREMGNIFKVPVDEIINSSINSVVVGTPEMLEEAGRLSNRVLQGHEFTLETERQRSDGTAVPVSISGMPFQVDDELMVYGIYRDISERKRAEEKLRKRLNFEEFISRTSSRIVFGTEMDELINESLVDLCGIIEASRGCLVFFEDVPRGLETIRRWAFRDEKLLPEDDEIPAPQDLIWMIDHLREFGQFISEDLASGDIPQEGRKLLVEELHVSSMIALPFYDEEKVHGYIGICDPWPDQVWNSQDINLLRTYRYIVGEAFLRKGAEEKLNRNLESLKNTFNATIDSVGKILEVRDPFTAGHQRRTARLAVAIAKELDLEKDRITGLYYASLVHDIGKINVPTEILSKPDRLTRIEEALVKHHCQYGWEILKKVDFPWPVAEIVLQHHEYMNGTGYPRGLTGENICLEARILTVADMVEAMSSDRPYRPALGLESALENIRRFSGSHYDPEVCRVCLSLFTEKGFTFDQNGQNEL